VTKIAVISDIHGNRWAFEAVLEDIERRGISRILNLGDCFYGPLDPIGTAEMLMELDPPTVMGNEDRMLFSAGSSETADRVAAMLDPLYLDWLKLSPLTRVANDQFVMFHGTPQRDDEYLLHRVEIDEVLSRSDEELLGLLGNVTASVILCGHDHFAQVRHLDDGRLIVNPGSVGLQAYTDDVPFPHAMQTGSPEARYAVLEKDAGNWRAGIVIVPYDWNAAAETAARNGSVDWADWLRTGRAE
jgi:putative phosphoesterase